MPVDNVFPFAAQTSPALVTAAAGGDVYTDDAAAHLYLPPHGLSRDTIVTVTALEASAMPETLPGGAARLGAGVEIGWGTVPLLKPGRSTWRCRGAPRRSLAIGFTLGRAGAVSVGVYDRAGRLVREVTNGLALGAGANVVRWDGRDREGRELQDGVYLVTISAFGDTATRTLALVR